MAELPQPPDFEEAFAIDRLLANNDPPSETDLARVLHDIDELQDQISTMKAKISSWTSQLHKLEDQLGQHRGVASAVRRVPTEILGQILLVYPFDTSASPLTMTRAGRQELVDLMLVSKRWRVAALATHKLWSAVQIDGVDAPRLAYDRAVVWLTRAGNAPRTLALHMNRVVDCPSMCTTDFTFASPCVMRRSPSLVRLLLYGPPIRTLSLDVRHRRCMDNIAKTFDRCGRLQDTLQTLYLTIQFTEEGSKYQFLPTFSSVTSVDLVGPGGLTHLAAVRSFVERLTRLSFGRDYDWEGDSLAVLSNCRNLEELSIFLCPESSSQLTPQSPTIYLQKVTTLHVTVGPSRDTDGASILKYLHFPALTTLEIVNARSSKYISLWRDFFQKHSAITSFECRGTTGAPLQAAFDHLPFLTRLSVGAEYTAINWLLSRMKRTVTTDDPWLPRLDQIELLDVGPRISLQDLFEFLATRSESCRDSKDPGTVKLTAIKTVTVQYLAKKDGSGLASRVGKLVRSDMVSALSKSGMTFNISSYRGNRS